MDTRFDRLRKLRERRQSDKETLVFAPKALHRIPTFGQFQYLPQLLSRVELIIFWVAAALLVITIPVFASRLYLVSTEQVAATGGSYTEGVVGVPKYINPLLSSLSDVDSDISALVFSGLFHYNAKQELEPDIITNYTVSDDQLTYTFYLRSDIRWHDGEQLDADDVLFTIQAIQDAQYQSPLRASLDDVTATKLDDYSFSLTLSEPYAPFLTGLVFGIMPEHLWFSVPPQTSTLTQLNLQPIGSGPFQFKELVKERGGAIKSLTLVRNPDYYAGVPYVDKYTFLFYPDSGQAIEALKDKRIDGLAFIPPEEHAAIAKKRPDVVFHNLRLPQYTALFFNQKNSEVLQDDTVRVALAYAVDRQRLIQEVLFGAGEEIFTPILPGYVGYNAEVEKYQLDLDKAKQLLEDAGWAYPDNPGEDFVPREKDGIKLEFTVSTVESSEYEQALHLLQENWQTIGVKVNVDLYSRKDIQTTIIKKRNYEALLFAEIVGNDPDPYPFWHSSQQEAPGLGLAIFRDAEVDDLLDEARKTSDPEERRLKYLHFQNNIADELPAIFLYNPLYSYAINERVKGIESEQYITLPADRLSEAAQWYIKTDRQKKQTQ